MGLFGNKEEKRAEDAAAEAQADRLAALPVADLAAVILPAFGPEGPGKGGDKDIGALQVGIYLMRDFPRGNHFIKVLLDPINEGIQTLENAGLVKRTVQSIGGSSVSSTRLGLQAIEDGSARKYLGGRAAADS
ncbi:MAG: hypothetical protein WB507_14300 [Solirubrobacterales bacterium]